MNCVLELKVDKRESLGRILGRAMQARGTGEAVRADANEEVLNVRLPTASIILRAIIS